MRRHNVSTGAQLVSSQASLLLKVSLLACLRTHTAGHIRTPATGSFTVTQLAMRYMRAITTARRFRDRAFDHSATAGRKANPCAQA